jgi:hypothetical protein
MQRLPILLFLGMIFLTGLIQAQKISNHYVSFNPESRNENGVRVVFYNVENLFDFRKDTLAKDDEFLPEGLYEWTPGKFFNKLQSISKVILSTGGWEPPEIIGLAEVENQSVVNLLATRFPLAPFGYKVVHYESPDVRGIDVALLFRPDKFRLIYSTPLIVKLSEEPLFSTRDILYIKGIVLNKDTLHLFVNHWPSKLGGEKLSAPHRRAAAQCLKKSIDSVLAINPAARVLVMGDLNDVPSSPVVQSLIEKDRLRINLMANPLQKKDKGSYKFYGKWSMIDQIIVSSALIQKNGLHVKDGACIFAASFLLVPDESFGGEKPFRSFQGPRYTGGYSDHLPVYVDLVYPK